jgi:hypothetical protein
VNAELRKMLGIGRTDDRQGSDVGRLSDAELRARSKPRSGRCFDLAELFERDRSVFETARSNG